MSSLTTDQNSPIRRYLLGDMRDEDAQRFEEEYFENDDRFSEMLAVEDDLISAYLSGRLGANERQLFETRFLATERGKQKIALAAALDEPPRIAARVRPTARRTLAIAASVFVALIAIGAIRDFTMRRQIETLRREQVTLQNDLAAKSADLERLRSRTASSVLAPALIYSLILSGTERGTGAASTIVLPQDATAAELWLILPRDEFQTYTATLQSIDGRALWTANGLTAHPIDGKTALKVTIPSAVLEPRTFVISVSGHRAVAPGEAVEDYSFSVRRP